MAAVTSCENTLLLFFKRDVGLCEANTLEHINTLLFDNNGFLYRKHYVRNTRHRNNL